MIYYRVAFQAEQSPTWTWKSTALTSLEAVFGFLRLYRAAPPDRLRVFSSSAKEDLNEQLMRANHGGASQSVTAAQFLQERKISLRGVTGETTERRAAERPAMVSVAVSDCHSLHENSTRERFLSEKSMSAVEWRRAELERGPGGDHDTPYTFVPPTSLPQALAWIRLLGKVQRGELAL